jgi:hypothetical protein
VKSKPIQELDYSSNRQDKPMKVLKKKKKTTTTTTTAAAGYFTWSTH